MTCRCAERVKQIRAARERIAGGDVRAGLRDLAQVGRTLIEDVRSGDLRQEAASRLAALRLARRG